MLYLHENKVIHRDLSHHNILIDWKEDVKICDFGQSKKIKRKNSRAQTVCGKYGYMAPELNQ